MNKFNKEREKKVFPAPILAIIHIVIAIFLGRLLPIPLPSSILIQWVGLGLTLFGFILGILALREFKQLKKINKNTPALVTSGVYKYSRNPVYLGFVLMLIGLPLNSGNYWGIVLIWSLITFINNFVIKPEEEILENKFKDQFTSYKTKVRRWI